VTGTALEILFTYHKDIGHGVGYHGISTGRYMHGMIAA